MFNRNSETPFNMAMLFYYGLDKLWNAKDEAYIEGDVFKWYLCLQAMYRKIVFKLNEKETKDLEIKFKKVAAALRRHPNIIRTSEHAREFVESPAAKWLHKIDRKIVNILHKNNMIFPQITTTYGLDKVKQRYNLGPKDS